MMAEDTVGNQTMQIPAGVDLVAEVVQEIKLPVAVPLTNMFKLKEAKESY